MKRKTAGNRLKRSLKRLWQWCRKHRHEPIAQQHQQLWRKVKGHFEYYGIKGNWRWLKRFREWVRGAWRYGLNRRGTRHAMPWSHFERVEREYPLPPVRIAHGYGVT